MQWYYSVDGQQQGPVSQAVLETLAKSGTITPDTLVWRDGMADWAAYSSIAQAGVASPAAAAVAAVAAVPAGDVARCAECGQTFSKEDMVSFENAYICAACKPLYFQKLREGVSVAGAGLWRYKKQVVTALNPVLPPRCVKCNVPTDIPPKKRNLYWHPPLVYLALFVNVLLYLIIAVLVRKRSTAMVSVCQVHRARRRNAIIVSWLLVLVGLGAVVAGIANEMGWVAGLGAALLLGGIIYGIVKGRLVYASKIDKEHVWMSGCGKDFLAELPEWTGA